MDENSEEQGGGGTTLGLAEFLLVSQFIIFFIEIPDFFNWLIIPKLISIGGSGAFLIYTTMRGFPVMTPLIATGANFILGVDWFPCVIVGYCVTAYMVNHPRVGGVVGTAITVATTVAAAKGAAAARAAKTAGAAGSTPAARELRIATGGESPAERTAAGTTAASRPSEARRTPAPSSGASGSGEGTAATTAQQPKDLPINERLGQSYDPYKQIDQKMNPERLEQLVQEGWEDDKEDGVAVQGNTVDLRRAA